MNPGGRRYSLESIVIVDVYKTGQITSMSEDTVDVVYADKSKEAVSWYHISPINLHVDVMVHLGFSLTRKTEHPHHMEYVMNIKINGRLYMARGIVLKDRSIWSFNNVSIRYLHQVQSLIWIIEPTYKIELW
jgi:hypothetical protein